MVQERDDVVPIDAAILTNPKVWEASGHLATFTDPLVDCRKCKERWRADQIDGTCPNCGSDRSHRGAAVQPDVQDLRRPRRRRVLGRLPAARDRPGDVRQLLQRRDDDAAQAALRHRPDRPGLPQRDHAGQLRVPHPRVRDDGAGVLRPARRQPALAASTGATSGSPGTCATGSPARSCACARTSRRSCRTTPRGRPTSSSSSPGAGASSRGSPTGPTSTCAPTRSTRASRSSTSTRRAASGTCPTSSSRQRGRPGR